jgi:alkaline phosphatase D
MNLSKAVLVAVAAYVLGPATGAAGPAEKAPWRIAFGSCCRPELPQPFWSAVQALQLAAWCWLGDNVYADTADLDRMREIYARQRAVPGYAALLAEGRIPVIGTWDDHDYGKNDAGKEFPAKAGSQQAFLDFMGEPADSPRRTQEGVYAARTFQDGPHAVKVILLDTRYHRDPIGSDGTILGETQWAWLAAQLNGSTADLHLIVSSIQVASAEHRFEKWGNFPKERSRLLDLVASSKARGVIFLSGDRHHAEISRIDPGGENAAGYPIYDVTSSSLTHPRKTSGEPNRHRLPDTGTIHERNFGLVEVDWESGAVHIRILDPEGRELMAHTAALANLRPR